MKVAWQFATWNAFTKKTRPGKARSESVYSQVHQSRLRMFIPTQSYRSLRDGFGFLRPLAVNCQATITWALRDKKLSRDLSAKSTPHQTIKSSLVAEFS